MQKDTWLRKLPDERLIRKSEGDEIIINKLFSIFVSGGEINMSLNSDIYGAGDY